MAFLDFNQPAGGFSVGSAKAADTVEASAFEPLEWEVIRLAQQDSLSSLRAPGWFDRILSWLFGGHYNAQLADERLETLRRTAVQAWHRGYAIPVSAIAAFKTAGFNLNQLESLLATISAGRPTRRHRRTA